MIRISDAELTSVLPPWIKEDVDVQAISYAFKMAAGKMLGFLKKSSPYGNIEELSENILDLMALEIQSQYYDSSMDIKIKRNIIRNSLAWHAKGGTVSAVSEMVETVFGMGKVVEWYEVGGKPGTFAIDTNTELSPDIIDKLNEIIDKVKNKKSHLINVKINRDIMKTCHTAIHTRCSMHIVTRDGGLVCTIQQPIHIAIKTIKQGQMTIRERR